MTLYEINSELESLIDPETGEITDFEAFEGLQIARADKLENIALYHKNLTAEADAIKAEIDKLTERKRALEAKSDRLKRYLDDALNGEGLKTARVVCSYRKTQAVECDDTFIGWARENADDLLTWKEPTANKTKIKEAIKQGREIQGAKIVDGLSLSIK